MFQRMLLGLEKELRGGLTAVWGFYSEMDIDDTLYCVYLQDGIRK